MNNRTILIAIPSLLVGGTEQQTLYLAKALVSAGYQCIVVCYFEYDYRMVQLFKLAGCEVECLSAYGTRPQGIHKTFTMLRSGLKRIVRNYRPAIAHVQYLAPGAMPVVILRLLGVRNIIATLHSDADIYKDLRLIHFLQRHLAHTFSCVSLTAEKNFFGSSCLFDDTTAIGKHNHCTIYNCIPEGYSPHTSDLRPHTSFTIGVVSRLVELKGMGLVMPAFAQLSQQNSSCRLLIVGDGAMRTEMKQQQRMLGIAEERVEWTGTVEHSQLKALYGMMDIVWIPSLTEGFGLTAVEAMSQGCVVVASDTGGLHDVVSDGVDGCLFEKGNVNDLVKKTLQIIDNSEGLTMMSNNAVRKAQQFSFENYKEKILELYERHN